ncbi:MAG: DUF3015 family protein [Desulfuromonadales bacterium]|uniref:DUF3015 family protein n=1 Tax=Desulfuromonas sp. KJ2020 TaxID=2919173 RepID=UPI0020A6E8AF|nr:DUF3015 family protein [Desulfuromonas sp. KJ2020]MCP3176108.1 DUF3015 domain-containing protein [Desulfuromonas sp. KJ2020]
MKKILVATLALSLLATTAFAAGQADRNTGCGLGSLLWEGKADGSVISQSLQATTNGTFGNQTFGITSGTLGCEQPANIIKNDRALAFTRDNLDPLARDIAAGGGETLETLAELLEVPAAERANLYSRLQSNFEQIFVTGQESSADVIDSIITIAG